MQKHKKIKNDPFGSFSILVGVGAALINNNQKSICISLNKLRGWIPSAAPAGKP